MVPMTWNKKTDSLFLAVGHGTQLNGVWDSGCAYGQYTEAALMLPIVKAAVKLLRKSKKSFLHSRTISILNISMP